MWFIRFIIELFSSPNKDLLRNIEKLDKKTKK
jgi:hypothetical protein